MIPHDSAFGHVTGSATYIDDRPLLAREVFVEIFYSPLAHAEILSIHLDEARAVPGVCGLYTAQDLTHNVWGSIFHDQPYLAEKIVHYVGEAIVIIAADSRAAALAARRKIQVEFRELPALLTLEEAIEKQSFIGPERSIQRGNATQALKQAPHRLEGCLDLAGQEHFYLESQASIAYPGENGSLEIHSSSQHPTEVQHMVAEALGLKFHQVVCVVQRMGGAFGGKESQAGPFTVYAALVAHKLQRPARMVLGKDDDMIMTGKRNPFKIFYEAGYSDEGQLLGLKARLYSNAGAYADLSTAIMERAMLHSDNAYYIPHFEVRGQVCRTHTHPTTAFRGFGGPKGVILIESILEDIAHSLKKDSLEVRECNVYQKGQTTPYGQEIDDAVLPELFARLKRESRYPEWRRSVIEHNQKNSSTLRGLSVTAVKFGISFTTRFLNQGGALVNLHLDGSLQISTGATEMGQGVNTKIALVAAEVFGIDAAHIKVMATSTEKIPNTSATAASSGADINAQATLEACLKIKERLARTARLLFSRSTEARGRAAYGAGTVEELELSQAQNWESLVFEKGQIYDPHNPQHTFSFSQLVEQAYLNRISLSAQGFYRYPGIHFNKESGQGRPFHYFTNGLAASEVSIDRYTGEMKVLRTDLLMDLGRPLHPGIDQGQVTGAFVQGMGWLTTEKLFYDRGRLVSCSPSTYKIPSIHDIPRHFHCELMENPLNARNVRGSKAVGEPPLMLAVSVWTAIKDALSSLHSAPITLKVPATQEEIFFALESQDKL